MHIVYDYRQALMQCFSGDAFIGWKPALNEAGPGFTDGAEKFQLIRFIVEYLAQEESKAYIIFKEYPQPRAFHRKPATGGR